LSQRHNVEQRTHRVIRPADHAADIFGYKMFLISCSHKLDLFLSVLAAALENAQFYGIKFLNVF